MLHRQWLKDKDLDMAVQHWVWSNGDGLHLNSRKKGPCVLLGDMLGSQEKLWHETFLVVLMGKGEHDGVDAVVKRALTYDEQLQWSLVEMCSWCCAIPSSTLIQWILHTPSKYRHVERIFWEVKVGDVNQQDYDAIPHAHSLHFVHKLLKTRWLDAFLQKFILLL